jgi:tetratricopeptide (TPR) repeat protein
MRSLLLALSLVLLALPVARSAEPTEAEQVRALYEKGMKEYNIGNFSVALESFQAAYLLKPDPAFLFNLGQCHRMMGNAKQEVYAYRRYLGESPDAPNRAAVEKFIADAEEELHRKAAAEPPTNTIAPTTPHPEPPPAQPVQTVQKQPEAPPADSATPIYKKWWLWVAVAAVVVVAAGIGIGVALGSPKDAPSAGGTFGTSMVNF